MSTRCLTAVHFRQHLPLWLLLAWGLIDLAVLITFSIMEAAGTLSTTIWDPVFFGLVVVQGSLVAAWFYLSDHWAGWHVLSLLVMILCLAACVPQPLWIAGTMVVHLLILAVVNYPLGILRDRGWRYRFHPVFPQARKPWQFSVACLIGTMFVIAVGFGLWRLLGWLHVVNVLSVENRWIRLGLHLAVLAWLPAIRVLAGIKQPGSVLMVASIVGIVHFRLLMLYVPTGDSRDAATMQTMIVAGALVLILQAAALRWAGWRIEHDPRRVGQQAAATTLLSPEIAAEIDSKAEV
jgi:hypothetical protein